MGVGHHQPFTRYFLRLYIGLVPAAVHSHLHLSTESPSLRLGCDTRTEVITEWEALIGIWHSIPGQQTTLISKSPLHFRGLHVSAFTRNIIKKATRKTLASSSFDKESLFSEAAQGLKPSMRTLLILSVHKFLSEETDKFEESDIHGNKRQRCAMKSLPPSVYPVGAGQSSTKQKPGVSTFRSFRCTQCKHVSTCSVPCTVLLLVGIFVLQILQLQSEMMGKD